MTKPADHCARSRVVAAWAVHAYTASGVLAGFFSLQAIFAFDAPRAFVWMLVAVLIDATDGVLARAARVEQILPGFDGAKLDDIVDYFTYVILPVALLFRFDLLPERGTLLFVAAPLLASAYGFCQTEAKTRCESDHFFTGFPSYWNIVAFYLYAGGLPNWLNGAVVCLLAAAVFVPVRYVYPTRTRTLRGLTNVLGAVWAVVLLILLVQMPEPRPWLVLASLSYPLYYAGLSLSLHVRAPSR